MTNELSPLADSKPEPGEGAADVPLTASSVASVQAEQPEADVAASAVKTEQQEATAQGSVNQERSDQRAGSRPKTAFRVSRPVLRLDDPFMPSYGSRLFAVLAYTPWLWLILLLALQTVFSLDARDLWYSDEVRHAAAFRGFLEGKQAVLELNGAAYPDKPPLYFFFLAGLLQVMQYLGVLAEEGPRLYFAATAVSALLFILSGQALGRMVGRFDGKGLLASGLILLTTGYMVGLVHYARMDLLFSAAIICSFIGFYRAVLCKRSLFWMLLACFFAALACLIKGPLGLLLPLAVVFVFCLWRGAIFRLLSLDMLAGLAVAGLILGAWVFAVYQEQGGLQFFYDEYWIKHTVARAQNAWHHKEPWHYYLVRLPLVLLPWSLAVFVLFGRGLFSSAVIKRQWTFLRSPQGEGVAYLWVIALVPVALLSALSGKIHIYYLPALPAVSLLAARALLQLPRLRASFLRGILALFYIAAGAAVILAAFMISGVLALPDIPGIPGWRIHDTAGLFLVGTLLMVAGVLLWAALRSSRVEGVLLLLALMAAVINYPAANLAAPAFNEVLSPKQQALELRHFIDNGYQAMTYKDYGGTYAYYSERVIPSVGSLDEVRQKVLAGERVIVSMKASTAQKWDEKPVELREVHRQWIETKEVVLLAAPVGENNEPLPPSVETPDLPSSSRPPTDIPADPPANPPSDIPEDAPADIVEVVDVQQAPDRPAQGLPGQAQSDTKEQPNEERQNMEDQPRIEEQSGITAQPVSSEDGQTASSGQAPEAVDQVSAASEPETIAGAKPSSLTEEEKAEQTSQQEHGPAESRLERTAQ